MLEKGLDKLMYRTYVGDMDGVNLSIDQREQRLIAAEHEIGRLRGIQMQDLAELDVAQVASADGARSLSEWVSARMDVSPETAKPLVQTMRRLAGRPHLDDQLAAGNVSFDRVEALSRIPEDVGLLEYTDVAGVHREATKRVRISVESEFRSARDRFLVIQPNLDESWFKLWGGLDGYSGGWSTRCSPKPPTGSPTFPTGPDLIFAGVRPPPWWKP
jgi:hypothetical protein